MGRMQRTRTGFGSGQAPVIGLAVSSLILIGAGLSWTAAGAGAQGKSVWDGVYTEAQSKRGESVSNGACTSCHGDQVAGTDIGPALKGEDFIAVWSGRSADELYEKIETTMPADRPGTLKPEEYADVLAYIFKLNAFPAGSSDLTADRAQLKGLQILARKP